ncbi:MAG: 2Fe-2S iron-sulfur cluster binding domain-containing protein [Deferribacterota bacterium]|nr:2Fe-2S iron-sulfur cluster binding domain-containing protein [Deferribacterota bacterium]
MFKKEYKIYINGSKDYYSVKANTNLYKFLISNNLIGETLCNGNGQCGRCKVLIKSASGKDINKPTKKDKLLLAAVNIENGYRLACQYLVKSDIIVKIDKEENLFIDSEFLSVKKKTKNTKITSNEELLSDTKNNLIHEKTTKSSDNNVYAETANNKDEMDNSTDETQEKVYNLTDGLILLQYTGGIKYYIYSAGIANISSNGLVKTEEQLSEIVRKNQISDFIYNNINLIDIERVIAILDKKYFDGEPLLNMINYYSMQVGTMLCEVIQPEYNPLDMLLFFRILYNNDKNNVFISLDFLNKIIYFKGKTLKELTFNNKTIPKSLNKLLEHGKNPIIDVDSNYNVILKDKYSQPDSIHINALTNTIKHLRKDGIITKGFHLEDRQSLVNKISIDKLIKLANKNGRPLFYVYRKKDKEYYVDQDLLDIMFLLKSFFNAIFKTIKSDIERIDGIYIFTTKNYKYLTNNLLELQILPKEFSEKLSYISGEPSIMCNKFFQYKDIKTYFTKNMTSYESISFEEQDLYSEFIGDLKQHFN